MKQFKERLNNYQNSGAARKAVWHFSNWTDEEREAANKLIVAKFGAFEDSKQKKRGRPEKATKVQKPVKAKVVRKPQPTKAQPQVRTAAVKRTAKPQANSAPKLASVERTIHLCHEAAATIKCLHDVHPALDYSASLQRTLETQNAALVALADSVDGLDVRLETVKVKRTNGKTDEAVAD